MMAAFHLLMRGSSCAEVGMVGVADRALAARPQRVHSAFARARMPDEHGDRTVPRGVRAPAPGRHAGVGGVAREPACRPSTTNRQRDGRELAPAIRSNSAGGLSRLVLPQAAASRGTLPVPNRHPHVVERGTRCRSMRQAPRCPSRPRTRAESACCHSRAFLRSPGCEVSACRSRPLSSSAPG